MRFFLVMLSFTFLLPVGVLGQVHTKEKKVGGSCGYKYTHSPAIVYMILPGKHTASDIYFIVNTDWGTDTMSYSSVNHGSLSNDTIAKYNIKRGDVFNYVSGDIYSGSCSPHIHFFKLTKYVPDKTKENLPAKSDCEFSKHLAALVVLSINPVDSVSVDITFRRFGQHKVDTVTYSQINHRYVSLEEIKQNNIRQGDWLTLEEKFALDKKCTIQYSAMVLFEKYDFLKQKD
jgi:hypothetical protein